MHIKVTITYRINNITKTLEHNCTFNVSEKKTLKDNVSCVLIAILHDFIVDPWSDRVQKIPIYKIIYITKEIILLMFYNINGKERIVSIVLFIGSTSYLTKKENVETIINTYKEESIKKYYNGLI